MWWGLTPALNLCNEAELPELSVLLIGQLDCRHVLQTLAKKYCHTKCKKINLYVYESNLENVGRSLLFLSLILDQNIGLGRKTQLFMDLYGNSLLRPPTWQYLNEASNRLAKIVANYNYAESILPAISLESLKYKDRDCLEHIFKFWNVTCEKFDILNFWEERVRNLLKTRYDARHGVYDWDLHMRFRPYGADVVTTQEYKLFREKGLSFFQEDTDPCIPNLTFASFPPTAKIPALGYFGDIVTGAYPAYGLTSEEKSLLKKYNNQIRNSSSKITWWNVQKMIYEIENQKPYESPPEDSSGCVVVPKDFSDQLQIRKNEYKKAPTSGTYTTYPLPDCKIIFLPTTALHDYPGKPQFHGLFDLVTIPQHMVSNLSQDWHLLCKPGALIVVESLKYALNLSKDDLAKAKVKLDAAMSNFKCEIVKPFDYKKDDFLRYKLSL